MEESQEQNESPNLVITKEEALAKGFFALTNGYELNEREMLKRVVADMEAGKISYSLVAENPERPDVISVYREP